MYPQACNIWLSYKKQMTVLYIVIVHIMIFFTDFCDLLIPYSS